MDKHRAIPQGYMTVGELAKKMGSTVRTLQYYDKEGLLTPSAESEGGRRLYTDKDVIKLQQIQSMKYLGFSLDDIKNRLVTLETPEQVAAVLRSQAETIREQIGSLSKALSAVEALAEETAKMETVDWRKYADIVAMLQVGIKEYWAIKYFGDKMLKRSLDIGEESSAKMMVVWKSLMEQVGSLKKESISPESEQGHAIAKAFWDFVTEFTDGDINLLPELMKFEESKDGWDEEWKADWESASDFIQASLGSYFESIGYNPFEGVQE